MLYQLNQGVVVPFIKKYNKFLFLAIAGIFIFTQFFALMQFSSAATTNIVVTPNDMATNIGDVVADPTSWFFYNDELDTIDSSLGSMVNGPSTPPLGNDSVQITVAGNQRRNLATYQFAGKKIGDVTELKYSTYNPSAGNGGSANRSGYLNFNVDFTGTNTWQKRLAYVPSVNSTVQQDTWQEWDTIDNGDALWWWSGYAKGVDNILGNSDDNKWPDNNTDEYRSLSDLLTAFPDMSVLASDPWMGIRVGEPYTTGYTENIDEFVFATGSEKTVFDFEQDSIESSKVWICHAPRTDKFVVINIDKAGAENGHGKGNGTHSDDIIPPFEGFPGLNWTVENQEYWEENCNKEGQVQGDCDSINRTDENNCEDGCYINDEFVIGDECNEPIELCEVTLFSDTTNTVNEKANANAMALTYLHPAWTASIPGATWVWGDNPVADPTNETIQTFKKTFYWNGTVTNAVLDIAADNDFEVFVNGVPAGSDFSGTSFGNKKNIDLTSYITSDALNTLEIRVTNWKWPTVNAQTNPAGLLYKTVVSGPNKDCGEQPVETPVPAVTLSAQKIVCDNESLLPNMHNGADIGPNTATNWVAQHEGCEIVNGWSYEYKTTGDQSNPGGTTYGPKGGDWNTFTAAGDSTTATKVVPLANTSLIQMREVLPENYIPFTDDTNNNVSAEFFCGSDVAGYDNWEWLQNLKDGDTYYCVAWNVPVERTFDVHADKVICDSEGELPNWGGGGSDITAATAQNWVNQSEGHCWLADWNFQWSPDNVGNPGDNMGVVAGDWTTFSNGTTSLPVDAVGEGSKVWFREVMDPNYVPFSGTPGNNPYSAEFYCNTDVLNYDNWDWISNPQADATYYCVGFNVLKPAVLNAVKIVCDTEEYLPNWGSGQTGPAQITSNTADRWLAVGDNSEHCQKVEWQFQWVSDTNSSSNPGDNTTTAELPWQTFSDSVSIDTATLGENNKIWAREVFDNNYVPFTGQNTTQDVSAEIYCGTDILNYDNWEFISDLQPGVNYYCVAWNVLATNGEIRGLIYNDVNGNNDQDESEPELEGWDALLLTRNSPFTIAGVDTTGSDGKFLFEDLTYGTYFVCQDLKSDWLQTELNALGTGLEITDLTVGTVLGDSPELDAKVAEFCYQVELTKDNPISENNIFGNYNTLISRTGTLGDSDTKDVPDETGGQGQGVLADTDTLATTGNPAYLQLAVGLAIAGLPVALYVNRKKFSSKK